MVIKHQAEQHSYDRRKNSVEASTTDDARVGQNHIWVSIVIPCRNEKKFIGECLNSIIASDFPKDKLEVLVVDGMSDDGTRETMETYPQNHPFIKILSNLRKITPVALNLGIRRSRGDFIIILGSHSKVDRNFIKANIENSEKYSADCVGGVMKTLPANDTLLARAISVALSHPFGMGNAYFRIGSNKPKSVDTVPFGCYRREVFEKIGLFDEDLVRNQDDEFNLRLLKQGGKIILVPEIISYYHARDSLLKLWKMFYQYGYFKPLVAKKVWAVLTWRQLIPAIFVLSLILFGLFSLLARPFFAVFLSIIFLYVASNLMFSMHIAAKKGGSYLLILPIAFATLHFSYGVGYLKGIWDFLLMHKQGRKKISDVVLNR